MSIETISQAEYQELMKRGGANKHGAVKCKVHKPAHDSQRECERYSELVTLEKTGHIRNLQEKVVFELAGKVKYAGEARATPALRYESDFTYEEWQPQEFDMKVCGTCGHERSRHAIGGEGMCLVEGVKSICDCKHGTIKRGAWVTVVEDSKGHKTADFKIKRQLMLTQLGIDVRLTR